MSDRLDETRAYSRFTVRSVKTGKCKEDFVLGCEKEEDEARKKSHIHVGGIAAPRVHLALQEVPGERPGGRQQEEEGRTHCQVRRDFDLVSQVSLTRFVNTSIPEPAF